MAYMLKLVPPDGHVLSSFVVHPVFRRDTFFKTVSDVLRDGTDGIESYMRQAAPPPQNERFTVPGYEQDLETRPPDLIVQDAYYTTDQKKALDQFFARHASEYAMGTVPGTQLKIVARKSDLVLDK